MSLTAYASETRKPIYAFKKEQKSLLHSERTKKRRLMKPVVLCTKYEEKKPASRLWVSLLPQARLTSQYMLSRKSKSHFCIQSELRSEG